MVGLLVVFWPVLGFAQSDHPAAKVAKTYLQHMANRNFQKAVKMVDDNSLVALQKDQVNYLKSAPTVDEEEAMLKRLEVSDISVFAKLSPVEAFVRHNKARHKSDAESLKLTKQMNDTLQMNILGTVKENNSLVHVFIRSKHQRKDKEVSTLDLVSLLKDGKTWKVSLNAQEPTFTIKEKPKK